MPNINYTTVGILSPIMLSACSCHSVEIAPLFQHTGMHSSLHLWLPLP